tara:strand:- start:987 stop:1478 length:492 start_codon:yes stop_codon:yes gene_type:complete
MNYPNGRVNILDNAPNSVFNLYDKIPVEQNITSYRNALTGNLEDNMLSKVFFSKGNIIILQKKIMKGVYDNSNGRFRIGYQDEDTLKIIMRSIFLQNAANNPNNITAQVEALNQIVADYCVPQICSEAQAYINYKNDVSNLAVPIQRPLSTYSNNTLELKKFF